MSENPPVSLVLQMVRGFLFPSHVIRLFRVLGHLRLFVGRYPLPYQKSIDCFLNDAPCIFSFLSQCLQLIHRSIQFQHVPEVLLIIELELSAAIGLGGL